MLLCVGVVVEVGVGWVWCVWEGVGGGVIVSVPSACAHVWTWSTLYGEFTIIGTGHNVVQVYFEQEEVSDGDK